MINIIDITFFSIVIYFILNVSSYLIYKNKKKKFDNGFFITFLEDEVDKNKIVYIFFTIFIILYNYIKYDNFKLKYYNYKIQYISYYKSTSSTNQIIIETNKLIHQLELKIKLKKLKIE